MAPASAEIKGTIRLDTAKWSPVAYMSLIKDFGQLNTVSYEMIIAKSEIRKDGLFFFPTHLLPEEEALYRIHFSKKGDPISSLIIGGRDNNHFFLLANKNSVIQVDVIGKSKFIERVSIQGYEPNIGILYTNNLVGMMDSLDHFGSSINRKFLRDAVIREILVFADSCSWAHAALYALYHIDFRSDYRVNKDYYDDFNYKWKDEESEYFNAFRNELGLEQEINYASVIYVGAALIILLLLLARQINKRKDPLKELTVQERKIFASLKEGKSNKEIAEEYSISLSTVKSHINSIYSKLNIRSRKEVVEIH
jgi:DNA-binding CsgD family transcriptional regulator